MISISMAKGDYIPLSLTLKDVDDNNIILSETQDLILTIKKDYKANTYLIQKIYSKGDIVYNSESETYDFAIEYKDTMSLNYGSYVGDLKLINNIQVDENTVDVRPNTLDLVDFTVSEEATNTSTKYEDLYD